MYKTGPLLVCYYMNAKTIELKENRVAFATKVTNILVLNQSNTSFK